MHLKQKAYPSGNSTTTLAPAVSAITFPSLVVFNHRKAPLNALPLLPPTSNPSLLIKTRTAAQASSSDVLTQALTSAGSRDRTSGTKSYPMPSTTYAAPSPAVLRAAGKARILPIFEADKGHLLGIVCSDDLLGEHRQLHIFD